MKKKQKNELAILSVGLLGALAVGGFAYKRFRGDEMPPMLQPVPGEGATDAPAFGVGSQYFPGTSYADRLQNWLTYGGTPPAFYQPTQPTPAFGVRLPPVGGGLVVTPGGGTQTPTYSSDPTPTAGSSFGVRVPGYGGN